MAGRAPRTRFTSQMDETIRARLQGASGRTRRGEVRRAVADAAAQLGLPTGAVLKRWYRLRALPARPQPAQRLRRPAGAAAPAAAVPAAAAPSPAGAGPAAPDPDAVAAYQRALVRTAACRAELARAEGELLEAAARLLEPRGGRP